MLKRRIIPILLLLEGRLVKTVQFGAWRDVGDPVKSASVYNSQYADEIILLNIDRERRSIKPLIEVLQRLSEVCFMPLSVGGGIHSIDDAAILIQNGADKIVINSTAYVSRDVITQVADRFGSQAVVVSIDAKRSADGRVSVFSDCSRNAEMIDFSDHVVNCQDAGAGEFLIQSIDRDGAMTGFDVELLQTACDLASVPVIGCGGSGQYYHLKEAFLETGVSALACGSLFNFSDSNPMRAKAFLSNYGIDLKVV